MSLTVKRIVVGLLTCSVKMYDSEPKLKVRTMDEMFKKISSTSSLSIKYDYKASNTSIHIQTHFSGYQISKTTSIDTIKTNRDINNGSSVGSSKA